MKTLLAVVAAFFVVLLFENGQSSCFNRMQNWFENFTFDFLTKL